MNYVIFRHSLVLREEAKESGLAIFADGEGGGVLASNPKATNLLGFYELQKQDCPTKENSHIDITLLGKIRVRCSEELEQGDYVEVDMTTSKVKKSADKGSSCGQVLHKSAAEGTVLIVVK